MTPEHTALVARIAELQKARYSSATNLVQALFDDSREAADAIRELAGGKGLLYGVLCDTEAERDTLRAEVAALKADPLHTMLMAQSTHRLGEIHRLEAEVAALKDLLSSIRAYKVIDAEVIGWIDAALADKPLSGPTP